MEFKQTLDCLLDTLKNYCSNLTINQAEDSDTYTLTAIWENTQQMQKALQSEDFAILSGAITALCDKTVIRLDDKVFNHQISDLIKQ